MKNVPIVFVLSMLLFATGCVTTKSLETKAQSIPKNTELLIGEFGYWKRDCSNRYFDIHIEQYPAGGDLRFEVGSLIIPDEPIIGSSGSCVGKNIQSKKVIYVPSPNFVGEDFVSYVVKSTRLLGNKAYEIDIKVQ